MKVLVVDDEPDIRDSLEEFFTDEGFAVTVAANGAEALSQLRAPDATLPSIMVLDVVMPLLRGDELYAVMQADPRLARVPVIISTSDPKRAPRGPLVMKKPIDLDALLAAVLRLSRSPDADV